MAKVNFKKIYAIQKKNKERLLKINPSLNEKPGIYFLTRERSDGIKFAYVGLASKSVLSRLEQHLHTYQHIDNSIRKHGFYSSENPEGWKINFINCSSDKVEEMERHYITLYAKNGYQMKNKDTGGGSGKEQISEYKPHKGYHDGLKQGYKNASKEIAHLMDLHLVVTTKQNPPTKLQAKALEKFNDFLNFSKKEEIEDGEKSE